MTQTVFTSKEKVPLRVLIGVKNDWTLEFKNDDGSAKDLTGYSFYGQIRDRVGGVLLADLTFDIDQIYNGILSFSISKTDSEAVGANGGVYDILQEEDADPTNLVRLFGGDVEIEMVVTEV